jgi:hypothetical protein
MPSLYQLDFRWATSVSSNACVLGGDKTATYPVSILSALDMGGFMNMRIVLLITAAAVWLHADGAVAVSLDMSTMTCEKFLQSTDARTLPIIVGWLVGHHAAKDAPPILDFEKADRRSAELLKVCRDNPSITVSAAVSG